ncbi:MAG: ABC transporter permease subunit [Lachnospiraceae bacterium]|nr:ABC transporter permease subunit [Lachnospiraceae bacterium]
MNSITYKSKIIKVGAILFWIVLWQLLAMYLHSDILLASPIKTAQCLKELIFLPDYWQSIGFTFARIGSGFLLALTLGVILGALSYIFLWLRVMLAPFVSVMKAIPVASFIILILIWVPSKNLSVVISFLIAFPVVFTNTLTGLAGMDEKMLEMMKVFHVPFWKRIRYVYVPQMIPYFKTACSLALGLCWKSGIAAEIIGLPAGSMGERLYQAKIYLSTPEMFAWTITIIVISTVFEKVIMILVNEVLNRLEGR